MNGSEIDPTRATSVDLNRRAFVGIAAAAATGVGTAASALGQPATPPLGRPHPPLVAEDDPGIVVERVEAAGPDAVTAYAAWPVHARANAPSVVVIMHLWGVDASIRDVVRRFAKAGFAAIAPDLYARFGAPSGDNGSDVATFRPYAKRLDRARYDGDARAAAMWLATKFPSTKTGIVGFCMGGRIAMLAAIDNDGVFCAVCPFYGPLNDVKPEELRIPICGSYGARDSGIPAESVRAFTEELLVPNDIRIYDDAGHAFFDDQRSAFVPAAAADAWKRTVAFLGKYAGQPNP
ncbi:MAG: dienelactone hydrolase family protein [Candidatus Tumulicola sp.]